MKKQYLMSSSYHGTGKVGRYLRGNQKSSIEDEQTTQWPKDKRTKGHTMMEKHCKDIRNTLNTGSKSGAAAKYI